ncbi:efflux transporter outer membrane subunit [Paraburkholderia kururiensis]|uniref:efflux transporter outer membrane subunit n=1 Tax=Paraburkholderia kururiensis TaxID=984307 RepID=UPI0005AA9C46|nr:efflux transporter outer membrane subunit [Paraburkholderia kururiensis]
MCTLLPSRRARFALAACLSALALQGCMVGPNFSKPGTPHVDRYLPGEPLPATLTAAGAAQTFSPGAPLRDDWWTLFQSKAIDAAVDETLTGNATLAGAQASLRRSEHELRAGAGVFFPQADAGASALRERYVGARLGSSAAPTIFNLFTLSASISYALDIWGGERRAVEGLAAQVDADRYALVATWLTLTSNVVNAMIARAAYSDEITATQEMIGLVDEQIALTKAQYEAGTAAWTAVLTLENERATLQASLPALAQKRAQTEHLLATLAGMLPADWQAPPVSLSDIALPATLPETVPSALVARRPDILQAEAALHVASANIGVATAALLPSVTLSASGSFNGTTVPTLFGSAGKAWTVGADATTPLFHGGSLWFQREAAKDAYDASRAAYQQVVLAAFQQVADTLRALQHDAEALAAQTRAVESSSEALRLLKVSYEVGTVDYLQILIADGQYHQARIAWLQANAQRLQDTVALYAALGGGWNEAR